MCISYSVEVKMKTKTQKQTKSNAQKKALKEKQYRMVASTLPPSNLPLRDRAVKALHLLRSETSSWQHAHTLTLMLTK